MEPDEQNLDPELRSAIKRIRGDHIASEVLRAKVAQSLEAPAPSPKYIMRWVIRGAIAASLLIVGGVVEHYRHERQEEREYAAANQGLLAAMAREYSQPATTGETQVITGISDPAGLRDELTRRLSRQIPLADLRPLGWDLKEAVIRPFEGAVAARLDFLKGDRRAVMYSLPQFAFSGAHAGDSYDIVVAGHPISGFITQDGVHCIVGEAGMPLDQLIPLRKHLQAL